MDRSVDYRSLPPAVRERVERFEGLSGLALTDQARWVVGLSDFAAKVAVGQAEWFAQVLAVDAFATAPDEGRLAAELEAVRTAPDMQGLQRTLRRLRNRWQLWVVWRHLLGLASLRETTKSLSFLADALIGAALQVVEGWEVARNGAPAAAESGAIQRLFVLALGKLGARELNLSSDVDLVFGYAAPGQTPSGVSCQKFFVRVAQRLIEVLHSVTEDGLVFRVDMRLRPYGLGGALTMHCAAMEKYFVAVGRDWERYAFIKARPCAGDLEAGAAFLDSIRPFVYRRYLDFGSVEAMREMKARRLAERRQADDLKQGAGGIRDAEFTVQVQQLMRGGRQPALQQPTFLGALATLQEARILDEATCTQLRSAYCFLRHSEHSIQAEVDRQGQQLPASDLSRLRLALSLGYDSYDAYLTDLATHRANVEAIFDQVLRVEATEFDRNLWAARDDPLQLARAGFGDGAQAAILLQELATARDRPSVEESGKRRLDELMPALLHMLSLTPDATKTLKRVLPILRTVLRRSTYLALLRDHLNVVERLISLTGASQWAADRLRQHPMLLDLLLQAPPAKQAPSRQALVEALGQRLGPELDEEAWLDELRLFKEQHSFQAAVAELLGGLPLMHVSDYLSHVAEAVLEHSARLAWQQCEVRYGAVEGITDRPFIVVGYGKLGGIELGPGSDLDLVFLHDLPVSASRFVHRLAQKLLHYLTAPTYFGPLYEIDMRLRPSGKAGTMVSSLKAFEAYQRSRAWVWEHQALVRARAVAGDAKLAQRFERTRIQLLRQPRSRETLRKEVEKMRRRMATQQRDEDLKSGVGGMVDIEFMVQYLVLAHAHAAPALAAHSDNVRVLEAAAEAGLLAQEDEENLVQAYLALRAQRHRELLDLDAAEAGVKVLQRHRDAVVKVWRRLFGAPRDV